MSLKTLEDIEEICEENNIWVCKHDLRQEAIKHIKQDNLQELFLSGRIDILPLYRRMIGQGMKNWIKHFFNIEESELEDSEFIKAYGFLMTDSPKLKRKIGEIS